MVRAQVELEQEKSEEQEFEKQFSLENFLQKVKLDSSPISPTFHNYATFLLPTFQIADKDATGVPIPDWKRLMLARKAAEKAKREAEEERLKQLEEKRLQSIPVWRRHLLQRKEEDGQL